MQGWAATSAGAPTGLVGGLNQTENRLAMRAAFARMRDSGDRNIRLVDGDALFHHAVGGTELDWLDRPRAVESPLRRRLVHFAWRSGESLMR